VTPRQQAADVLARIDATLTQAEGDWSGVGVTIGSYFGGQGDLVREQLARYRSDLLPALVREADKLAASDAAGWTQWSKAATSMLATIERISQMAASGTVFGVLAETAVEVARTTRAAVRETKAAVSSVWGARHLLVLAVVAVAVVVVGANLLARGRG
jgi:hypothetical protein